MRKLRSNGHLTYIFLLLLGKFVMACVTLLAIATMMSVMVVNVLGQGDGEKGNKMGCQCFQVIQCGYLFPKRCVIAIFSIFCQVCHKVQYRAKVCVHLEFSKSML